MRILIISQHYWPEIGGAEVQLRRLAGRWRDMGHSPTILTCRWDESWPKEEDDQGTRIIRLPVWKSRFLGTIHHVAGIRKWMNQHAGEFDAVYVSMLKHAAFTAIEACRKHNLPCIARAEGAGATGDVEWQRRAILGNWIRRRCQRADAFIAPSPEIVAEMIENGYPANRIHFIANGVSMPEKPWSAEECRHYRTELGLAELPTICFTGRLVIEKGVIELLEAVTSLQRKGGLRLQLVLVGDGPIRTNLEERARFTNAGSVRLIGASQDVERFLRAADLFVLPSHFEGLSLSLLEALALGVPSIASDIPANRCLAPPTVLPLFEPKNAVALASAIKSNLKSSGKERIEERRDVVRARFHLNDVATKHIELFQSISGQRCLSADP